MGNATTVLYKGRPFYLRNRGAVTLMRRAIVARLQGDETTARQLVSLAVRIEAALVTSAEGFDKANAVLAGVAR